MGSLNKTTFNTTWIQLEKPDNFDDPNHDLNFKRKSKNLPAIKTNIQAICNLPWDALTVDYKGRVFICSCDGWLPFPIGNVLDFGTIDDAFNSAQAKTIQQSVLDKTYNFCSTVDCGISESKFRDDPSLGLSHRSIDLNITIDTSCNLSCPSCRERIIFVKDKEMLSEKFTWINQMVNWVNTTNRKVNVRYGGGDPFASLLYKETFKLFAKNNNVNFTIMTNGLLIKNNKHSISKIFDRIHFRISIDASTKETYEKIRRGGKWEQLLENLEYLKSKISPNKKPHGIFIIQTGNFKEIPKFINFCEEYSMIPKFALVEDWGTWHNYAEHCVHIPESPHYAEFTKIIKDYNIKIG